MSPVICTQRKVYILNFFESYTSNKGVHHIYDVRINFIT